MCVVTTEVRFRPSKLFTRRRSARAAPAGRKRKDPVFPGRWNSRHTAPRPPAWVEALGFPAPTVSRADHQSSAAGESCGKARLRVDSFERSCDVGEGARAAFTGSRRDSAAGGRRWVEDGVRILLLRDAFSLYECSRGGGTRTPGLRFWRPPLYQLSYAPGLARIVARLIWNPCSREAAAGHGCALFPACARLRGPSVCGRTRSRGRGGTVDRRARRCRACDLAGLARSPRFQVSRNTAYPLRVAEAEDTKSLWRQFSTNKDDKALRDRLTSHGRAAGEVRGGPARNQGSRRTWRRATSSCTGCSG